MWFADPDPWFADPDTQVILARGHKDTWENGRWVKVLTAD